MLAQRSTPPHVQHLSDTTGQQPDGSGMWMFAPTYFDAADQKSDNQFAPSDPVSYLSHTRVLPLSIVVGPVMAFVGIDNRSLKS